MRIRIPTAAALCLLSAALLFSKDPGFSADAAVDWAKARITVTVSLALDPSIASVQRAQADAEAAIDSSFTGLLLDKLSPIVLDSSRTVGSLAASDPAFFSWIQTVARGARKSSLHLTADLSRVVAGYEIPLFTDKGIAAPLYPAETSALFRRPGFVPTRAFTGIVIYAREPLPLVGEAGNRNAVPAVFPRLFDEEMNVVYEKGMCRPEALAKWGMAGYAESPEDLQAMERCGLYPLVTVARAVFGANRTDLVISSRAVRQILALDSNIELLRQGRVLVIYKP